MGKPAFWPRLSAINILLSASIPYSLMMRYAGSFQNKHKTYARSYSWANIADQMLNTYAFLTESVYCFNHPKT
jgi:hypothetical protein